MKDAGALWKVFGDGTLVAALVFLSCCCADAASLDDAGAAMDSTGLSDVTVVSLLSVAACVCLVIAVVGCASCCRTGFAKFEETTTETTVVGQNYTSFSDFSPPTMSTPSVPPSDDLGPETVTIEPLPRLPGRTSNQWVNVLRVGGGAGAGGDGSLGAPGQTLQNIKLIDSPRFQFPRSQVSYVDEMGNGWFGKVLQGEAQRMHPGLRKTRVVIKQLRDMATPEEQLLFLQEVQPYREVNHPNVMLLLGQCIDSMPLLLILEYAPFGDLKSYLRKHRTDMHDMARQDIQLNMAADMVSGLMWLHQADFIYIDLATRNCQVSADTSVKIGDYGLSLEKYPDDYYITKDNSQAIPIRWLGPEVIDLSEDGSIKTKKITKESNVWSFGIMMLELSTGAKRPYAKLTDDEVLQQVVKEQEIRVDKPNLNVHYASKWFEVMMYCWLEADIRPTMKELHDLIMYLKNQRDRVDMPDFEAHWNTLKPSVLQESSESGKEEEVAPMSAAAPTIGVPEQQPASGFQDDFVGQKATEMRQMEASVPAFAEKPSAGRFDSEFGAAPVAATAAVTSNATANLNRNMNAETGGDGGYRPRFQDDFVVTAEVRPAVESVPVLGPRASEVQSSPPFAGVEGGIELRSVVEPEFVLPSSAAVVQSQPATDSSVQPRPSGQEDLIASATVAVPEARRSSTPVDGQEAALEPSADISALNSVPADEGGPGSYISTASMSLNRTAPTPGHVSVEFHPFVGSEEDDGGQTQFLSFDPSQQTPANDQTRSELDDDTFDTAQGEESTCVIMTDTGEVLSHVSLAQPNDLSPDPSPTQFTGFVSAEMPEQVEVPDAAVPLSEDTPQAFQVEESTVDVDGSLVVEPPGEETMAQSGILDFTDFSQATPQQFSSNVTVEPSEPANSPLTLTLSTQGEELGMSEGALIVQTEPGDSSVTRTFSSSSSSSSTRVVRTVRTVRQVQMVGGEEVTTVGEVMTPEGASTVSLVTGQDGQETVVRTLSGAEAQMTSSQTSYQSSQQFVSSSVMTAGDGDGPVASFTIAPSGEMMAGSSGLTLVQQSSGQTMASLDAGGATTTSVVRQVSGETSSSSVTHHISSSSVTAAASSDVQVDPQGVLQQFAEGMPAGLPTGSEVQLAGDDNSALLGQLGSVGGDGTSGGDGWTVSGFSQSSSSSSSLSLSKTEVTSRVISVSSSEVGEVGEVGQRQVTMSGSQSLSQSEQQTSSIQLTTKNAGDGGQLPLTFNLDLGTPNGGSLAEGEPGTTVDRTMTVTTGPGQMSVGQAMTMQGTGSSVRELDNGAQVSVQWQEHSVFTSEVPPSGQAGDLMDRLAGQSNQLAITSPEGESVD